MGFGDSSYLTVDSVSLSVENKDCISRGSGQVSTEEALWWYGTSCPFPLCPLQSSTHSRHHLNFTCQPIKNSCQSKINCKSFSSNHRIPNLRRGRRPCPHQWRRDHKCEIAEKERMTRHSHWEKSQRQKRTRAQYLKKIRFSGITQNAEMDSVLLTSWRRSVVPSGPCETVTSFRLSGLKYGRPNLSDLKWTTESVIASKTSCPEGFFVTGSKHSIITIPSINFRIQFRFKIRAVKSGCYIVLRTGDVVDSSCKESNQLTWCIGDQLGPSYKVLLYSYEKHIHIETVMRTWGQEGGKWIQRGQSDCWLVLDGLCDAFSSPSHPELPGVFSVRKNLEISSTGPKLDPGEWRSGDPLDIYQ